MSKRFFPLALLLLTAVACYDDSEIKSTLAQHESRIAALETLCAQMNADIASLKQLLDADFISSCTEIKEGGEVVGYRLTLAKGGSIDIYNGKDGGTPLISARQDSDGRYYWTVNGEWMYDSTGHKIPLTGEDGLTPQLEIRNDSWYVSYDGQTWTKIGSATGTSFASMFSGVDVYGGAVTVHLSAGGSFTIPLRQSFKIGGDETNDAVAFVGSVTLDLVLPASLRKSDFSAIRAFITVSNGTSQDIYTKAVSTDCNDWTVSLSAPVFTDGTYSGGAAVTVKYNGKAYGATAMLEATLVWSDGSVSETMRPIMANPGSGSGALAYDECGMYPVSGSKKQYVTGTSQKIRDRYDGKVSFILVYDNGTSLEIAGIPQDASLGDAFTVTCRQYNRADRTSQSSYAVHVAKSVSGKLWLLSDAGDCFVVEI